MKTILKLLLPAAALCLGAGTAHAQAAPAGPAPAGPGLQGENSAVRNGGDTMDRDAMMARDAELAKAGGRDRAGKTHTPRSVPAKPEDVLVGAEVRDMKGVHVGTIESVSMAAAVLKADGGAVEVPLEAFGKDSQGLLIGMSKADFDKIVADAIKPAH